MDKRTITALLLMFILFMVFNQFVWKPQQAQKQQAAAAIPAPAEAAVAPATVDSVVANPIADSLLVGADQAETITLTNDLMSVTFNSLGGTIQQVELKKFLMHDGKFVQLIPQDQSIAGLKLIHPGSETPLSRIPFQYQVAEDSLSISFFLGSPEAKQVEKRFTLDSRYGIGLDVNISNYQSMNGIELDFSSGIADTERITKSKAQDYKFLFYADNEIQKTGLSKMKKAQPWGSFSSFNWMALRSKYFTLALKEKDPSLMRNFKTGINATTGNPFFTIDSKQPASKQSWNQSFVLYTGPNDYLILKDYGKQMDSIPERGISWLRWLSNVFAWLLNFLHRYIKNYGVVLLVFAVLMKLLLHPLTHKQMEHGMKQQKLQPYLEEIRKKYPNDLVKQREEMKLLYKEHKTSMGAGCLPVLIQMPIIIPLYSVLRYSLDMRNAYFGLWLKDLSEPDPYMILPIIMGVFMLAQSLLMRPAQMDDANLTEQQKMQKSQMKMMTWMMPIMMFFIFKGMPAGLVLYWTAFNILSVIHQFYVNKKFKNKENQ